MASSDVIKIGFDYRGSLKQFLQETNNSFDQVEKQGNKIIIKIDTNAKEVQKQLNSLTNKKLKNLTIDLNDKPLKQQSQMLDVIKKQILNIVEMANKGYSLDQIINATNAIDQLDSLEGKVKTVSNEIKNTKKSTSGSLIDENQFKAIIDLFTQMESHLSSLKSVISDVGDGEEFSPLLTSINRVSSAVSELSVATSKIKMNVGIDIGSDISEKLNQKVAQVNSRLLEAYKKMFSLMRSSGKTNKEMLQFFEPDGASVSELIGQYKGIIERAIAQFSTSIKKNGKLVKSNAFKDLLGENYTAALKEIENAKRQLSRAESKQGENGILENLFGKTDLSGVIEQLTLIVSKLDEISISANKFTEFFKTGLNVNASVEEINKLTSKVKELEAELTKIKSTSPVTSSSVTGSQQVVETSKNLDSVVASEERVQREAKETASAVNNIVFKPNTETFDQIIAKFKILKEQAEQIETIIKSTQSGNVTYTAKLKNGTTYTLGENSHPQEIRAREIVYETKEEEKLANSIGKTREQTELARQAEEKRIEVAQNNAINKHLEEEFQKKQKLARQTEELAQKNKELALSYTESASKKLSDAISKYSYGNSFDAKSMMQQMNRGLVNFGDLSNIEAQIKTFDSIIDKIIADLKQSSTETEAALNKEIQQEELKQKQKDSFNKSNLNAIDMEIQKREELGRLESAQIKAQMTSREALLSQLQTSIKNYEDIYIAKENKTKSSEWTPNVKYTENLKALAAANKELSDFRTSMSRVSNWSAEQIDEMNRLIGNCENAANAFKLLSAAEQGFKSVSVEKTISKINQLLKDNPKYSQKAKAELNALLKQLRSGDITNTTLSKIKADILKIKNAEEAAKRSGNSFMSIFKNKAVYGFIGQMQSYLSMYLGFYGIINKIRSTITTVKELDTALIDLKKTTSMNSVQLESFYYDSNDVARQMGVTTKEIIEQASAWSRLGYSSAEASTEMAKLSSQFASISPGMDVTSSQEGLVSIMKAWGLNYDQVKSEIMDPINRLGNTMAESNQDIVEGMKRSAAALAAVGTSTKDAFAMFSGIQEVLQNAEKSGTALRSVALRIRSFDESTEEYSDDLANITGELVDLTKTAEHAEGVSIFKPGSTEEFKDLTDYFREIADIWDEMSQKQQNDFLLKAFGRTQAQAGSALIQNFKGVDKALKEMEQSAGSADKEMSTIEQSIEYKSNNLKQIWVGVAQDIADRGTLGSIIDSLSAISEGIGAVVGKLGLLKTAALAVTAALSFKNVGRVKMYTLCVVIV